MPADRPSQRAPKNRAFIDLTPDGRMAERSAPIPPACPWTPTAGDKDKRLSLDNRGALGSELRSRRPTHSPFRLRSNLDSPSDRPGRLLYIGEVVEVPATPAAVGEPRRPRTRAKEPPISIEELKKLPPDDILAIEGIIKSRKSRVAKERRQTKETGPADSAKRG